MKTTRFGSFLLSAVFLALFVFSGLAEAAEQNAKLAGKYYVETFSGAKDSIDSIAFLPDEKCVVDLGDGAGGLAGSYHGISDGKLTLEYGSPKTVRAFDAKLENRTLTLTDRDGVETYFVLPPEPPYPKAEDMIGMYLLERDSGDFADAVVYRRNADHTGEALYRLISKKQHSYRDFHLNTKWTYADGISTYTLESSDLPPEFRYKFSRDFISKRDTKGIWSLDTTTGEYLCEVPVDKFELPPPPAGYRTGR